MRLVLWLMVLVLSAAEAGTEVDEVVKKANLAAYYAGDDGRVEARMLIVDAKGNKQMRQFVILRRNVALAGDQTFLVVFSRPTDVKNTVFLVHKHVNGTDDRWLYLPALDLEKRIAASDKRTSFVGSHFYYEDVSGRLPALDEHRIHSETADEVVLRSEPKDPDAVAFSYYETRIDKKTWLPMKTIYFNQKDQPVREMTVVEVQTIEGHPTVMKSQMKNLITGGHTLLAFRKPDYDLGLSESVFHTRSLRHPPARWIQ